MKVQPWELPVHPGSEGRAEGVIRVLKQSDNVTIRVLRKPPDRNSDEPGDSLVMRIVGADSLFIGGRLKQGQLDLFGTSTGQENWLLPLAHRGIRDGMEGKSQGETWEAPTGSVFPADKSVYKAEPKSPTKPDRGVGGVHSTVDLRDNITLKEGRGSAVEMPPQEGKTGVIARKGSNTPREKVRELQRQLASLAKAEDRRYYLLYDKVYREDVLEEAWRLVKENKGAPGVDGVSIEGIEEQGADQFLTTIKEALRTGKYRVRKVRRVYIPKPDGKKRVLGIPTVADRVVETAMKLLMEAIFDPSFEDCSFGFRPGRDAKGASLEVYKWLNFGYTTVVDADIKSCFDSIPHQELMELIKRKIVDRKFLKLLRAVLRSGILEGEQTLRDKKGTPQGSPLSPLLANIYLDQLDKNWVNDKRAHLVRYADDLVILTTPDRGKEGYKKLKVALEGIGLSLNEEKSRVVETKDGFDFLGFHFKRQWNKKRGKEVTYVIPTRKALSRIRQKIRGVVNRRVQLSPKEIVDKVNPILRGWANYYKHVNAEKSYRKIQWFVENRIRRHLRFRRHRGGYGYREYPTEFLREELGLINIRGGVCYVR